MYVCVHETIHKAPCDVCNRMRNFFSLLRMYVCVVCMYVCVYVWIDVCNEAHTKRLVTCATGWGILFCFCACVYLCVCVYACMRVCHGVQSILWCMQHYRIHICMCMYICMYVCMYQYTKQSVCNVCNTCEDIILFLSLSLSLSVCVCACMACMHVCAYFETLTSWTNTHLKPQVPRQYVSTNTAILIMIEDQFQIFRRFSSSKVVLKAVASCFVTLNYHENGSLILYPHVCMRCISGTLGWVSWWKTRKN